MGERTVLGIAYRGQKMLSNNYLSILFSISLSGVTKEGNLTVNLGASTIWLINDGGEIDTNAWTGAAQNVWRGGAATDETAVVGTATIEDLAGTETWDKSMLLWAVGKSKNVFTLVI